MGRRGRGRGGAQATVYDFPLRELSSLALILAAVAVRA